MRRRFLDSSRLEGAERSIDLTMFILSDDATGRAVVAALGDCAKRGVEVRVTLDAVGCIRTSRKAARALRAAGAQMRTFLSLWHSPLRGRTNLRSHRKIAIVDGKMVFAGGMNIANEYMGAPLSEGTAPRWRDVAAIVRGPVAADATALFESDRAFCGGSSRRENEPRAATAITASGDASVQFVPIGPDMMSDTMYDLFLNGIFSARERVAIVTPYFIPDEA